MSGNSSLAKTKGTGFQLPQCRTVDTDSLWCHCLEHNTLTLSEAEPEQVVAGNSTSGLQAGSAIYQIVFAFRYWIDRYDASANSWQGAYTNIGSGTSPGVTKLHDHCAFELESHIWIIGGRDCTNQVDSNKVFQWDPVGNFWYTPIPDFPVTYAGNACQWVNLNNFSLTTV